MIETVGGIVDAVAERKGSTRRIGLSVDEWNVWRMTEHRTGEDPSAPFRAPRPIAEDQQDLADALVVGSLLITLLRHADRVSIACLAQLVNVIAPIRTIDGGPAWRQTTYYPFADVARHGHGTVLRLDVDGPTYDATGEGRVPGIQATAVHDPGTPALTFFAVNRLTRPVTLEATLRDLELADGPVTLEHRVLADPDIHASNTAMDPDRIAPRVATGARLEAGRLTATLAPRSWNVLRLIAD
jgi:alpha-N-arabinofuranosidase